MLSHGLLLSASGGSRRHLKGLPLNLPGVRPRRLSQLTKQLENLAPSPAVGSCAVWLSSVLLARIRIKCAFGFEQKSVPVDACPLTLVRICVRFLSLYLGRHQRAIGR